MFNIPKEINNYKHLYIYQSIKYLYLCTLYILASRVGVNEVILSSQLCPVTGTGTLLCAVTCSMGALCTLHVHTSDMHIYTVIFTYSSTLFLTNVSVRLLSPGEAGWLAALLSIFFFFFVKQHVEEVR